MSKEKQKEIEKYEACPKKVDALVNEELSAYIKPVQQTVLRILKAILVPIYKE